MEESAYLSLAGQDRAPATGPVRVLTRRALLHRGGLAGMALLLSACSAPAPSPPQVVTSAPSPTSPPKPGAASAPATSAPASAVSTTSAPPVAVSTSAAGAAP